MSEVAYTPQLRFPEFHDNWNPTIFGKYVEKHKGGASLKPKDFVKKSTCEVIPKKAIQSGGLLALDEDNPTYCSEVFFGDNLRNVVDSSYLITTLRDLVPSGPSIGYIVRNHISNPLILAQGVYGFILKSGIDKEFLIQLSNRVDYRRLMQKIMVGSTQVHIRTQDFFGISLNLPTLSEQQKIAAFLTAVDTKIEQLSKKQALLGEYKKGLMQQIFSQAIRFKADDGSDFPDWKENKVDEFMEVTRGQVLAVPEMRQVESEIFKYPVYSSQTKNNGLTGYYTDYLFEDCITWTTDGANAGDVNYRAGKFYCTNVCGVLRSKKGYANLCIAQILNSVSRRYVSYVGNPKLMNNVMEKIKISIPSSINEQTKIANFLSSVDSKIEEVGKQLDESKQFKKALLQKMFV